MGRRSKSWQKHYETLHELQILANATGHSWFIVNPQPAKAAEHQVQRTVSLDSPIKLDDIQLDPTNGVAS